MHLCYLARDDDDDAFVDTTAMWQRTAKKAKQTYNVFSTARNEKKNE